MTLTRRGFLKKLGRLSLASYTLFSLPTLLDAALAEPATRGLGRKFSFSENYLYYYHVEFDGFPNAARARLSFESGGSEYKASFDVNPYFPWSLLAHYGLSTTGRIDEDLDLLIPQHHKYSFEYKLLGFTVMEDVSEIGFDYENREIFYSGKIYVGKGPVVIPIERESPVKIDFKDYPEDNMPVDNVTGLWRALKNHATLIGSTPKLTPGDTLSLNPLYVVGAGEIAQVNIDVNVVSDRVHRIEAKLADEEKQHLFDLSFPIKFKLYDGKPMEIYVREAIGGKFRNIHGILEEIY